LHWKHYPSGITYPGEHAEQVLRVLQVRLVSHLLITEFNVAPEKHVKHISGFTISHVAQLSLHFNLQVFPSIERAYPIEHF